MASKIGAVLPPRSWEGAFERDPRFLRQCRKTKLCIFFDKGACLKGEACAFAHGSGELAAEADLRKTSLCPRWCQNACPLDSAECSYAHGAAELRITAAFSASIAEKQKLEHRGDNGGKAPLGRGVVTSPQEPSAVAGGSEVLGDGAPQQLFSLVGSLGARAEPRHRSGAVAPPSPGLRCGPRRSDPRFRLQCRKTKPCSFFASGSCLKGARCNFAHGADDLEPTPNLTKTSLCPQWLRSACALHPAECPYAHGLGELRSTELFCDPEDSTSPGKGGTAAVAGAAAVAAPSPGVAPGSSPLRISADLLPCPEGESIGGPLRRATAAATGAGRRGEGSGTGEARPAGVASGEEGMPGTQLPLPPPPPQPAQQVTYVILPIAVPTFVAPATATPAVAAVPIDEMLRQAMPSYYED